MKKKILFIVPHFLNGGAEKNLIRVINNLSEEAYDISILCLQHLGNNADLLRKGIKIIDIDTPSIYLSIFKIARVIKQIKPDVIFCWMGYLNAYMAFFIPFFRKKFKWFCRESNIPTLVNTQFKFPWLFDFFYKKLNRYDKIIAQSAVMSKDLQVNFGVLPGKIIIINNSIDFKENEKNKTCVLEKEPGKFYLLFVGGLRIEKRAHILIDALALLPENYMLVIVGSGDELEKVTIAIHSQHLQKRVEIISDCYNPVPYYQRADCLLLSSAFEGFPNVVIEAFACGCPAIGYNIAGGANEALDNYGGFSLQDKSVQDFADNIIWVCESARLDREKIIRNCKDKYDINRVIPIYDSIFSEPNH
ncbi:MAG: glycosyltransferase [Ginsengibacter sp.]